MKTPVHSGNTFISGETVCIITIPCYNEPNIERTILSLVACDRPDKPVEVLVLVNAYTHSSPSIIATNKRSYQSLQALAEKYNTPSFQIIPLYTDSIVYKYSGAGIPRKMAMDEAVRRLASINKDEGVIVSLDADCLVDSNYLTAIVEAFSDEKVQAATLAFHHPVEHLAENNPLRLAMQQYELYMHYYRACLEYVGYPYPYYTIGSAMAVRASAYTRAGGMGRQAAGEDFYFLQKVFPLGKVVHINRARVYPEARFSDRVPFGTGPALKKIIEEEGLQKTSYSFASFVALKQLFDLLPRLYDPLFSATELEILPPYLQDFLEEDDFLQRVAEVRSNAAGFATFKKRFFGYFNGFKIIKYLNFVHPNYLALQNVQQAYTLLKQQYVANK